MSYGTVLFDLDGTLLDTLDDLTFSVNEFLGRHGFPQRSRKEVRAFLGNGAAELLQSSLPERADSETLQQYLREYKGIYESHLSEATRPYDGVPELLKKLKDCGIKTGVISNKPDWAVRSLCEQHFGDLLDACVGDRPELLRKPNPEPLNVVMAQLGSDPADTLYVGDSEVDIETARNAGVAECSVTWGFRDKPDLLKHGPDHVADSPAQLFDIVAPPNQRAHNIE